MSVTFLYMFYGFCWREPEREKPEEKEEEEAWEEKEEEEAWEDNILDIKLLSTVPS